MRILSLISSFSGGLTTGFVLSTYLLLNHKDLHPLEYSYKRNCDTLIQDLKNNK